MGKKCENCGKGINDDYIRVCSHCGFSACKLCVGVTTCPKCKYSGSMKKP